MLYDIVVREKKLNKLKVIVTIIGILCIAVLFMLAVNRVKIYQEGKIYTKQLEEKEAEFKRIEAQEREEARIREEEQKRKNEQALNPEQIEAIQHIYKGTEQKRVFLTFDDGPSQTVTPFILDLLKQENIKATFFLLGNRVKANPDIVRREFEEGHYVANHGYTHKYSEIYASPEATLAEYNQTEQWIQEALQNPNYHSRVFRFPGGSNGGYYDEIKQQAKALMLQNGIVHLDWNALSKDAEGAHTKETLFENIKETMGEKQSVIILMHDSGNKILTYEMLPTLIQYLRENGYVFQSLYDIL